MKNGLAVVPIERGASGGSFFTIPPQIQVEIGSRKKIITDEHSGRILVDAELANRRERENGKNVFKTYKPLLNNFFKKAFIKIDKGLFYFNKIFTN